MAGVIVLGAMLLYLGLGPARAEAGFQLGFQDGLLEASHHGKSAPAYAAVTAVNAHFIRIPVGWASVAPASLPPGFDASNPGDPNYQWAPIDAAVSYATANHLAVILTFTNAPTWAQGPGPIKQYVSPGAWDPNPTEFAEFMHAAAARYSGSYGGLPRVRYWEPWNEPNIPGYFSAPDPVSAYSALLNQAYRAIKSVHSDNLVGLGGLAPVSPVPGSIPPLDFGMQLLCLHQAGKGYRADRTCPDRADFDAFAIHPYALAATPTKHAYTPGDVLVGDMDKIGDLVHTADRLHTDAPRIHHQIWVTEFSWNTNPPNTQVGDPDATAARYVAYSLYEMWKAGTDLVIWETILDTPGEDFPGRGLYWAPGQPKLMLSALAFPLVAGVKDRRGFAWGRTPVGHAARVVVQVAAGRSWRRVAALTTASDGTFYVTFPARRNGLYRARVIGGPTSLAYNSKPIPPRRTHLFTIF